MKVTKQDIVAVVMGGPSAEAEISRATGGAIAAALREKGYTAVELELEPQRCAEQLRVSGASVVFNAVHGMYGEDGRLQSILEAGGIPYTGSGVLASAVAFDKCATKRFLQAAGISTPACLMFDAQEGLKPEEIKERIVSRFSLPVVIKAAAQGSSIGVEIVRSAGDICRALQETFRYCGHILVEEFISGQELTIALMESGGRLQALPVIMIVPHSGAYDFHSKYTRGATDYLVPAPLEEAVTTKVQALAAQTYRTLGLSGVARVDIMLDAAGRAYVLEANTIPGMTATSLVPKAAAAQGISFPDLCEMILQSAK